MAHPLKASVPVTTNTTVAQLILKYLDLEGIDHMFGIPGGATMNLSDEIKKQGKINYIICRQETGATYMADGYQRISGGVGVVLVTAGPGACNALTGAMNAQSSGSRVLVLTGEVPEQYYGMGYLQEGVDANLDVQAVYANAVASSAIISNGANAQTLVEEALRTVLADPPGVAHLSMPDDIVGGEVTRENKKTKALEPCSPDNPCPFPEGPSGYRATGPAVLPRNDEAIAQALGILLEAKKPLLFVGNGCRQALQNGALEPLIELVETLGIPVMTTPQGKGLFPESHDLSLRNWGLGYCEWPQYYMGATGEGHFDALVILASSLGELATVKWSTLVIPDGKLVQIDLDPGALGRVYPLDLGIVADVGASIRHFAHLASFANPTGVEDRKKAVAAIKSAHSPFHSPEKYAPDPSQPNASPLLPQRAMKSIQDHLDSDAHIFIDSGNCFGWAAHYLEVDPPKTFNIALNMGPMGVAVGAVVGGKIAAPDKTVIAIVGDGAFMMQGAEVSTAAANDVGAIWVVLNDNDLGMVSQGMNKYFPDAKEGDPPTTPTYEDSSWYDYYKLGDPDLAKFAEGLGAKGYTVRTAAEMDEYFPQAIAAAKKDKQPQVVVVHVDGSQIPPYYQKPAVQ